MADEKHLLLTFGGSYTDASINAESWQVGVRLALVMGAVDPVGTLPSNWDPVAHDINRTETKWTIVGNWKADSLTPPASFDPGDYLNDHAAPAWTTFLASTICSDKLKTEYAKLYPIGAPTGRAIPAVPYTSGTPCTLAWTSLYPKGGSGSNLLPLQNSFAVSWRTAQVGRRGRGRIFMPPTTVAAADAYGFLSSTFQTNLKNAAVTFLQALAVTPVGPTAPHVRPIVTGSPFTQYGVISQVRVDNVIDTQRRRRRSLDGTILTGTPSY